MAETKWTKDSESEARVWAGERGSKSRVIAAALDEIKRLQEAEERAQKVLEEESANARGVFAELQKMTGQRDMAVTKHEIAHVLVESLGADVARLREELIGAWTHEDDCPCQVGIPLPVAKPPEHCTCGLKEALYG